MHENLDRMAISAQGGITLHFMRFIQASAPFIWDVLGFTSLKEVFNSFKH